MTDAVALDLAAEFAPELIQQAFLDSIVWDETEILMPGTDWRGGHIWLTVPGKVKDVRKVGRGKDATEEPYLRPTTFLLRDDYLVKEYTQPNVQELGYDFPPVYNHALNARWSQPDMADFLLKRTGSPSGADIFRELRATYLEFIEFSEPIYYDMLPLYIIGSYVFRVFSSVGYLHFNGTASSGKTQNLNMLKAFGLNAQLTSNTSTSALFRTLACNPGVLCLDEAESFHDDTGKDIRKLLLSGYRRGGSVIRSEKLSDTMPYTPIEYPVYSPKALASIATQDDVLGSRAILISMTPALRRIGDFNHEDPRWNALRNKLYRWALTHGRDVAQASADWDRPDTGKRHTLAPNLISRQWQTSQIFLTVADAIGLDSLIPGLVEFFNTYYAKQQRLRQDTDLQTTVLRCLPRVVRTKTPGFGSDYYSIKDIHATVLEQLEEDQHDYFKSRKATATMRVLGFDQTKATRDGLHFRIDPTVLKAKLEHRQIEPFDDDANWYSDLNSGVPLRDPTLDWLETYAEEKTD